MESIIKKIMWINLLSVCLVLFYWLQTVKEAETRYNDDYPYYLGQLADARLKLFHTETADLSDLAAFNSSREHLGISLINLGITQKQLAQAKKTCHRNEAYHLYQRMATNGFELWTYNLIREQAKAADLNLTALFSQEPIFIRVKNNNGQLLYQDGWRLASPEEVAKFKAIEAEEKIRRLEEEAKAEAAHQACLKVNPVTWYLWVDGQQIELSQTYTLAEVLRDYGPNHDFQMNGLDHCAKVMPASFNWEISGNPIKIDIIKSPDGHYEYMTELARDWWHDNNDNYEVKTYVDINQILAKDGLKVVDSYIAVN